VRRAFPLGANGGDGRFDLGIKFEHGGGGSELANRIGDGSASVTLRFAWGKMPSGEAVGGETCLGV
jgi:hypothetical protein